MPVRGLDTLRLHHPIPAFDKIGTFVIEADPLPRGGPRGVERDFPFFHLPITVGAFSYFLLLHIPLLKKLSPAIRRQRHKV